MRKIALHWKILIGLALGVILGLLLNEFWTSQTWQGLGVGDAKAFLKGLESSANKDTGLAAGLVRVLITLNEVVGQLFVRGLRFIAVPIILFTLIVAMAGLGNPRKLGRIGGKTFAIFGVTVVIAVLVALALGNLIRPGVGISAETRERIAATQAEEAQKKIASSNEAKKSLTVRDQLVNAITTNPFKSLADGEMLQVVVAAMLIGFGLTLIPKEKSDPVVKVCEGLGEAILALVRVLLRLAPIAVFALIVPILANLGFDALAALAKYCVTVLLGLGFVLLIEYPALLLLFTKRQNRVGYRRFFKGLAPAQMLAFSSSSSAATLPVTMECCNDRLGVPEDITGFVCPLGTTVNMDGTALYQVISVLFLAQLYGVDLSWSQQATVGVLATLVAIGAPGLPSASVVMMVVVLQAVGIPAEGIALVLAVDRVLDMARTIVNVSGDAVAAVIVASSEGRLAPDPLSGKTPPSQPPA